MRKYNYIYKTTNTINNKIYIGRHSTDKLNDGYIGSGTYLKHAIKKYGKNNFNTEIIFYCLPCDFYINQNEIRLIRENNSRHPNGYNLTIGGEGQNGHHPSEESRAKMRISQGGINHPMFGKRGQNNPNFGSKRSEEARKNISKSLIGRPSSTKGKTISEERKMEISRFHKGKTISIEQRRKISIAGLGRIVSDDTRKKISESKIGIKNPFYGTIPYNKGMKYPKKECPHCGKIGGGNKMKFLHFDNCKYKE